MSPFIEENDEDIIYNVEDTDSRFEQGMVSHFFQNDRKYWFIGGTAVAVVLIAVIAMMNSSMSSVNIDELPVIQADKIPIREKPLKNNQVKHQDKVIYDNISGNHRKVEEKIVKQPETVLSIPEIDVSESLSDEDKQLIIQAFDELAPEKEYKINYVEAHPTIARNQKTYAVLSDEENITLNKLKNKRQLSAQEKRQLAFLTKKIEDSYKLAPPPEELKPPLKNITAKSQQKKKHRLKDLVASKANNVKLAEEISRSRKGAIMVQIASVRSKAAAESEYKRLLIQNRFLKGKGKKIYKVDLGPSKGVRYRIQVGPFKNKAEAKKIISAMRDNGCSAYISK